MRRFTASLLAVAALAGGALSGVALASPPHHDRASVDTRSVDRHGSSSRDRSHDTSRDGAQGERETRS